MHWLLHETRWERAVIAVIAAAIAYQCFCEPIVGTADNRDWWRVTKQLGIEYHGNPDETFFKNFQRDYVLVPEQPVQYLTSQVLLGRLALALNDVLSKDGLFDIRWMGFVNAAAYLAAIAVLLVAFHRRPTWVRITTGLAAIVMFTDVRLVAYFNTFYSEPAQLIFLIASIGFALLTIDPSCSSRVRTQLYAAFLACSVLFFFAKTQDLVFCVPFAVIAAVIFPDARPWRRLTVAAFFIAAFVWGMKSDAYAVTHNVNIGVALAEEILPHSKTPDADLQELGDGDPKNVTFARIATFYAKHPARWWKLCKRRIKQAFTRTPYGNFEKPMAGESKAFDEFSSWKDRRYPRSLWFWIIAMSAYAAALAAKWRFGARTDRQLAILNAMLVMGCVLQFVAVVTFEANGTEKHFFIFNVLVDLVLLLAVFEIARVVRLCTAKLGGRQ